jgi:hypothetical protein
MKKHLASASLAILALLAPQPYFSGPDNNRIQSGIGKALAQSAVSVDKITIAAGGMTISIPTLSVEGSSASEADIRAMFDPKGVDQLASRFKALSARSVTIPEISISQKLPDGTLSNTIYRDTVMRDISNGIVGAVNTRQAVAKVDSPKSGEPKPAVGKTVNGRLVLKADDTAPPSFDLTMNDMAYKGLNITLLVRFLYEKAAPGEQLQTAVAEQTVGKSVFRIGAGTVTIDRILATDFKLKPLSSPFMQTVSAIEDAQKNKKEASEKEMLQITRDMLASFSFGKFEATGISGAFPVEDNKISRMSLDTMRMSGGGDVPGGFSMLGLKVDHLDNRVGVGEFTFAGVRYPELAATLEKLAASGNASDFKPENMVPTIEQIRLAAIDVDVRTGKDKSERLKAKLGQFDIRMGNHVGPIPANVVILLDRAQMDIPANTTEKGLKDILALGYKALDVSMRYDQSWDQASKVLKLNELSLNSVGMFATSAKAELTNVAKEIFTLDKAVANVAALGVMARSVSVSVKNEGLFEKLIAQQAAAQKRKPEDVRAELAAGATLMVPLFLGEHPGAQVLGAALGKFLADPKNLRVNMVAKDAGLGAVDFLAVKNPIELLKKVDITAEANR